MQAPIAVRPVSALAGAVPRRLNDFSLGGLRAYSDERYTPGERLELELCMADGESAVVLVEVVWLEALPAPGPAHFDVGMRFIDASPESLALIRRALSGDRGTP